MTNATSPTDLNEHDDIFMNSDFSKDELHVALHSMKLGKSAGPDGIFAEFQLHLGRKEKLSY